MMTACADAPNNPVQDSFARGSWSAELLVRKVKGLPHLETPLPCWACYLGLNDTVERSGGTALRSWLRWEQE